MQMNYFGIIKKEEIEEYSIESIEHYLLEKDIYFKSFSINQMEKMMSPTFVSNYDETETSLYAPLELIHEFNDFIFKIYEKHVSSSKHNYFSKFNEEFYGLEYSELRKIALSDFNEIYDNLKIVHVTLIDERISATGISHTYTTGKLFKLYHFQQDIKKLMATTENLLSFLIGDISFYNEDFFEQNIEVRNAVHVEIVKQILVEINDKYSFEEDIYYSKKVSEAFKFKDYNYIFKNLKSYQFTNKMIKNCKNIKRNYIESLYQVLLEFDLITDHKENFIAFIKNEYRFKVSKITTFSPKQNIQNDKRVKLLTQEWENHDVEKNLLDMFQDF
nr:hypothetical protein [uncultured Flavobacterium sp.]